MFFLKLLIKLVSTKYHNTVKVQIYFASIRISINICTFNNYANHIVAALYAIVNSVAKVEAC